MMESGLGEHCVACYLDTADMAAKILILAGSKPLREQIGRQCRESSKTFFRMEKYIEQLDNIALKLCDRMRQEKMDVKTILDTGIYRQDFSALPYSEKLTKEESIRRYVRAWASGMGRRKPYPGFHPGIYKEQRGLEIQVPDPLADFLRSGQPDGPWNYPVLNTDNSETTDLPVNERVALHLHVYYPDLLPQITERLMENQIRPDLFVSVTHKKSLEYADNILKNYDGRIVDTTIAPNRGRDIGPLITAFGQKIIDGYDFVGHIHTKKTADIKNETVIRIWFRFLLENLLGGTTCPMADRILTKMHHDATIGMVFPDDPNAIGWDENRVIAENLASRLEIHHLPENFIFPVGTMFWARTAALAPLVDLHLDWSDYPGEPLPYDGSLLHAIERLLPFIVSSGDKTSIRLSFS